jgi:K+-sensing histidine kinase KdpD
MCLRADERVIAALSAAEQASMQACRTRCVPRSYTDASRTASELEPSMKLLRIRRQMRSSLLSAVSHDRRTPLPAIMGAATALRDGAAHVPVREQEELHVRRPARNEEVSLMSSQYSPRRSTTRTKSSKSTGFRT